MMATAEFPVTAAPAAARPYSVLICDDQPDVLHALQLLLKGQGYEAVTVDSPRALLQKARSCEFDLILADLNYTGAIQHRAKKDSTCSRDWNRRATPHL